MNNNDELQWLKTLPESVMDVVISKKVTGKVRLSKEEYRRLKRDIGK